MDNVHVSATEKENAFYESLMWEIGTRPRAIKLALPFTYPILNIPHLRRKGVYYEQDEPNE